MEKFKISSSVMLELEKIRDKLPMRVGSGTYDNPSGLVLLGHKDRYIDTVVKLTATGGCWDAPSVSFRKVHDGLVKMIDKDRTIVGMALMRHMDSSNESDSTNMPGDMRSNINQWKNSFENIEDTLWMVVGDFNIGIYRPELDKDGRLTMIKHDNAEFIDLDDCEHWEQELINANRRMKPKPVRKMASPKDKLKMELKAKKKLVVDIGSGMCFKLDHKGEYILCRI